MNIFGTDGIRGKVNQWPMTVELIQKVAISAASIYFGKGGSNLNRVIIGKDTRLSGYMLEPALVAGLVGESIAQQIEKKVNYRRAVKKAIQSMLQVFQSNN